MVEINFFADNKHLLAGAEVGSKITYLVAKIGCHITAHMSPALAVVGFKTKQNSIWSKALKVPQVDHMELCLSYKQKFFSQNRLLTP